MGSAASLAPEAGGRGGAVEIPGAPSVLGVQPLLLRHASPAVRV